MASMLLRHDLLPACLRRPFRESRALFFAATSPDLAVRASFQEASQIQHAGPAASGWRGRTQARSWSTAGAGTSADAVGFAVGRLGASRLPSAMSPRFDGCCWRGGGVALYRAPSATKSLSGGRSTSNQKLTNKDIKARTVMLVVEKADGSKETTVVSRKQALAAAVTANLDLVQVNAKTSPVVCKLMDFKREEYRLKRLAKATSRRVQKTKEIHMRGLIGDHDFERKVNDVKKYLDRGDMVKVVMEAPMSLLKRSLHCLVDLQVKFEEHMDSTTVLMKPSAGSINGLNRREVLCTPKKAKVPARERRKPRESGVLAAGKVLTPPHRIGGVNGGVDQSTAFELVGAREGQEGNLASVPEFSTTDSAHEDAVGLEHSDDSSDDESDDDSDEDGERSGGDKKESLNESLDLQDALLWEMEQNPDYGEEVDLAAEWELSQARKKSPRGEADAERRAKDGSLKRGADRKTGKRRSGGADNDSDGGGGFSEGGSRREANEELGGDSRRNRATKRREGGQGGRREGGRGGGGRGGGGGYGRGTPHSPTGIGHSGNFQWGAGRGGFPEQGRGDGGRWGGRGGNRGAGDDGERRAPAPPVRSTPYKWGTTLKSEGPVAAAGAATAVPAPALVVTSAVTQPLREGSDPRGAETEPRRQRGGEGGGGDGDFDGGRGGAFRAKFGGDGTAAAAAARSGGGGGGSGEQHRWAPHMPATSLKGWINGASTDRFQFPTPPAAATASAPIVPSREESVHNSHSHGGSPDDSRGDSRDERNGKPAELDPDSGEGRKG